MQNKKWIILIIFGLLLITIIPFVENVKADVTVVNTYYFDALGSGGWTNNPSYMYDGNNATYASNNVGQSVVENLYGTTCNGVDIGAVSKVEIRVRGYYSGVAGTTTSRNIYFTINGGIANAYVLTTSAAWSPYKDITSDMLLYDGTYWGGIDKSTVEIAVINPTSKTMYCSRVELQVTFVLTTSVMNIVTSSVYPVNNTYVYPSVTLSWNCTAGGQYNYYLYKKIGAGSYFLSDTKTNQAAGTTMFYRRWFNATSLNTLYTWKICMKNYTINNWKNFSYQFYINDTTVHLSDTKTNVAGTLTSLRNNTGFYITSNHNSSITPYNHAINSSLTHVYYWVTNTWRDYANSTGTTTPFTYHNNTINVSSSKQLKLLSNGYHLWDNSSSGIMSYTNFINCTGTLQKAWYQSLGKFKIWANVTGNTTSCSCNSTNLTVNEVLTNCHGNYTTYYNPLTGWFVNNTYIGNSTLSHFLIKINITNLSGYVKWTGTHTFNTTNISFNATGNTTEIGNVTINTDDYFLSGILTFESTQFFLMILIGLWCFFIVEYYTHKELLFAFVQLLFAFPLTLYLAGITFFTSQMMILPLLFIIPLLSLYIVIDGFFYRTKKKV
jgi:hypothetical protein